MEEEVSRMKTFLKEFNNEQIQSPTSDEIAHTRIGKYGLDPEDVTGQVIDWLLNYLDTSKCPYSLALSIAKDAAQQVSASLSAPSQSETNDDEKDSNSTKLYEETIKKLPAICNSFLSQANLKPSCTSKYATSVFAIRNKRRKMEDRHVIHHDLNALLDLKDAPHQSYYAVFDGHSGIDAACYASAQLHVNIAKHPDFFTDTPKAIIEGYQVTDLNFLKKCNKWDIKSGCTAVSALIRDNTIYLSWLGDSQAVLVKEGVPVMITNPHKPDREDEKRRIESLGGHVSFVGTWRVNGLLAVTRAIGDPDQKQYIISEPDVCVLNLDGKEDFLIIACDGLWDGMSPEDVIGVLYRYLVDSSPDEPFDAVAAKLVHQSKLQGSEDNITAIVVFLGDIQDIKENAVKFVSNSYCTQSHDFMSMNGSMKTFDSEHTIDTPFSKPNVLELNAASSKKLKNAANVMNSAGFGSASYSYQFVESAAESAFQSLNSSAVDAQNVFHSQNVTASCFAPEATALSELPTPPIDDMLASQQFENFYSTDLYKELSNSMHSSQTVDVDSSVVTNPVSDENVQSVSADSLLQPAKDDFIADSNDMSLLDTENSINANSDAKFSPDEAVGIASTVVSTAIETAVKCLSSSETQDSVPAQSPKKLNPYAKPFVMKSFFNPEESETKTCTFESSETETDHTSLTSSEEHFSKLGNPVIIDTDFPLERVTNQSMPDSIVLEQFTDDKLSCIAGSTATEFITNQEMNQPVTDIGTCGHSELESKLSTEQDTNLSLTESNLPEQLIDQTSGELISDHSLEISVTSFISDEDLSDVLEKNIVLKSDIAQEHVIDQDSGISLKENVIENICQETVHKENKLSDTSDRLTKNFETSNLMEDIIVHDMNVLSISEESKDTILSPLSSEIAFPQTEIPGQESVTDVTMQSLINLKQSDLPEHNQNFDLGHVSMNLTSENISVISEDESKHESIKKCVIDTVVKDDLFGTAHLLESLTNQPLSFINTQLEPTHMEIQAKTPKQEPEVRFDTHCVESFIESGLPCTNQNSNSGEILMGVTFENTASDNVDDESKYITIEKHIVDSGEKNITEASQLAKSIPSEPISLLNIKNELIPAEAEVPSDPSVEDSHAETVAVDLKSLPVGIPEAEGVTEDIDSDSEKDGGWSYMKGNTVSGTKSKPGEKASKTLKSSENKSNSTSKGRRDVPKTNLDVKSKVKNTIADKTKSSLADKTKTVAADKTKTALADKTKTALADKSKTVSLDKSKTAMTDKSKNVSSVDKTKTLASVDRTRKTLIEKRPDVKTKVMKSSTLSTTTKMTVDKTSRVTGVSSIKKETTETTKTTSTLSKSTRPTTLVRASAPASRPIGTTVTDRSAAANKVATRPKVTTTFTENKSAVRNATSTLSKGLTIAQTKSSTAPSRTVPTRPLNTIPSKTSTTAKSSVQKSTANESKPKQPVSATVSAVKKPLVTTIKRSEVKEVKDSVNKQILAKKTTTTGKVESSSTLVSRKVASASTKSTISRVASSAAKTEVSKKDVPKGPGLKSMPKNVGSKINRDASKGKEKNVESIQFKTEETKNSLNIENDQKNITEIVQVTEEKFIIETTDKEIKEKSEVSDEVKKVEEGSLISSVTPIEDETPAAECTPESL